MTRAPRAAFSIALRVGLGLVLGALLIVAGLLKLRDPAGFAVEIGNYQLFPALAPYLAAALPVIEIVVGLGLVLAPAPWRRAAAVAAAALLLAFGAAVTSAYLRGINIACGCFGGGGDAISLLTVARNLGLLAAVAALLALDRPSRTAPGGAPQPS